METGWAIHSAHFTNITLTSILRRVLRLKGFCYRWARWKKLSQGVMRSGSRLGGDTTTMPVMPKPGAGLQDTQPASA